jgi:hypothetical protein
LDVFAASKDVQTVSVVAVVARQLDLENVFVHPIHKHTAQISTAMDNNLHLMPLFNLAQRQHQEAAVYSLCQNGRNTNESVMKNKE